MKRLVKLLAILSFIYCSSVFALNTQQLQYLQRAVLEMCRGGNIEGNLSKISVTTSAKGKIVVIKGMLEGGLDASAEVTKEQWDGIKVLANPDNYSQCVESTLNLLVPKLE